MVLLDANYTLVKPRLQIALTITHDVPADFHEGNPAPLRAPLCKGLHRKASDLRDVRGGQQARGEFRRWHTHEF